MIFVIISTERSQEYTRPSISSLLTNTDFGIEDKIFILDNDDTLGPISGVQVIKQKQPLSFAENANMALALSRAAGQDLALLNNDVIYTPGWLSYLRASNTTDILIPMSNQNVCYGYGSLSLKTAMDWSEFCSKSHELNQISRMHRRSYETRSRYDAEILMPFFCVIIPQAAARIVGEFDQGFGRGGGEDVDYRIRALLSGIQVLHATESFVLHFMGKSTWRSGETAEKTHASDSLYREEFRKKWGEKISRLFLSGGRKESIALEYDVLTLFMNRNFADLIRVLR